MVTFSLLHTLVTAFMFGVTYYAWRQNLYFIWYAKQMQSWMVATHSILSDEELFRDDALHLWTEDKPVVDYWLGESDHGRFPCLLMMASTLLLACLVPVGLTNWVVVIVACFSTSAGAVICKTLWERKHLIRGMYMGYQAILDAVETLEESDEEHV